jgi:hypothetical protein
MHRFILSATIGLTLFSGSQTRAEIVFSDAFNYTVGQNLVGQNGGSGFSSAYTTPGTSTTTIQSPLAGTTGNSVAIGTGDVVFRTMSASRTTGTATSYYFSFLSRLSPADVNGGVGLSLFGGTTNEYLFVGMPTGQGGKLGIEAGGVKSVWSGTSLNTTYLQMLEIKDNGADTLLNLYASDNLTLTGDALIVLGVRATRTTSDFTFNNIRFYGSTTGIGVGGMAMATSANEAVGITVASVPEPGTLLLGGIAAACSGTGVWWKRRKRQPQAETTEQPAAI